MLNELYELLQAYKRAGIRAEERALGLEEGARKDGIRVYLTADGCIARLEYVQSQQMKAILKWSTGSGITLPVFNLDPIYALPHDDLDRLRRAWSNCVRKKCRFDEPHPKSALLRWPALSKERSITKDLAGAFINVSAEICTAAGGSFRAGGDAWERLLAVFAKLDALEFVSCLGEALRCWIRLGNAPKSAFGLLYCDKDKKKHPKIPIQFEAEGSFIAPIYSPQAQRWLIKVRQAFTAARANTMGSGPAERDGNPPQPKAVWGADAGCIDTYPVVGSPIGQLSFFNRDISQKPTSLRYGLEFAVFPVGSDIRQDFLTAWKWLIADERRNKTWTVKLKPKRGGSKNKSEPFLLLSFLDQQIDTPAHLVELFAGPPDDESDRATVQFETICSEVIRALDGIPSLRSEAQIKVVGLHKPDPGRTQIFCVESFTVVNLRALAEAWQADCRKLPLILLPQFSAPAKDEVMQRAEASLRLSVKDVPPDIPFPYQVIECLNTIWEKCETSQEAKAEASADLCFGDAFELLRRTGDHPTDPPYLGRLLVLAIRRALPLLAAVGQAAHGPDLSSHKVFLAMGERGKHVRKSSFQARSWPCILSLLLCRLGYELKPATTMKEPAYLIGRFLAQLDRLHAYYAKYVSGKDEGLRQLLGNSLMSVALESPQRALELAGQRLLPYQAWAEQFSRGRDKYHDEQKKRDAGYVGSILWDLGRIAEALSECGVPEENRARLPERKGHESKAPAKPILDLSDTLKAEDRAWMYADAAAKAQMLLGYLARPAKKIEANEPNPEVLPDFEEQPAEA